MLQEGKLLQRPQVLMFWERVSFPGDELLFLETEVRAALEQSQHFHIHVSLASAQCRGLQVN